jgi:type II secretory ATPase GspE/PulE/Tfp pilus assembly ATPase PilB-like protein
VRLPSALSDIEVRMTSVPVAEGQAAALRIADRMKVFLPLESLGFAEQSLRSIKEMLTNPEGLVLVTGPTGSGKTTSVYSMLQSISDESQNIVSIEDPVEYSAPYLRQIAVDEDHGLTMTVGLQTILRMDPDVIFLGEIRSPEAASIAIQAASSGKCVFSTLHTRSVASTIEAMRLLHPENRDLASSLAAIVNQRIVRRLCTECRYEIPVPETVAMKFQEFKLQVPEVLFKCKGCPRCDGTGTRGRIGVYEVALMDQAFREAILAQVSVKQLQDLYINDNESEKRPSLIQDALQKAAEGLISVDDAMMIRWS